MKGYGNIFYDIALISEAHKYFTGQGELGEKKYNKLKLEIQTDLELHKDDEMPFTYNNIKSVYDCINFNCKNIKQLKKVNEIWRYILKANKTGTVQDKLKALAKIKLEIKYNLHSYEIIERLLPAHILSGENMYGEEFRSCIFHLSLTENIMNLLEGLTPNQVYGLFPIEKEYNGEILGIKDYYYCIQEANKIGLDKTMTSDDTRHYVMECNTNIFIRLIGTGIMSLVSDYNNWDMNDIISIFKEINEECEKPQLQVIK